MTDNGSESGQAMILVLIMSFVLLLLTSFVYGGSLVIGARQDALAVADESARAGAQALTGSTRSGTVGIDQPAAVSAAQRYLAGTADHYQGTVTVTGTTVTVTVTRQYDLGRVGDLLWGGATVSATGSAAPLHGVITGSGS
jgi:hypothetical protein